MATYYYQPVSGKIVSYLESFFKKKVNNLFQFASIVAVRRGFDRNSATGSNRSLRVAISVQSDWV